MMKLAVALTALLGVASAADCNPTNMYSGATSGPWFEASNWALNRIPAQYDNVEVNGKTVVVDNVGSPVVVHDVVIDNGGLIVIEAGNRFDIDSNAGCAPATTAAPATTGAAATTAAATTGAATGAATTGAPATTVNGATTAAPATTVNGATTAAPATTVNGATTAAPATTVNGATTAAPATTVNGATTAAPATTVNGATTAVPATTVNGATTAVPATTVNGATTSVPATTAAATSGAAASTAAATTAAATTAAATTAAGTTTEAPVVTRTRPPVASSPETCQAVVIYSLKPDLVLGNFRYTLVMMNIFREQGFPVDVASAGKAVDGKLPVTFTITQAANHDSAEQTYEEIVKQLNAIKDALGDNYETLEINAEDSTCVEVGSPSARISPPVAAVLAVFGAVGAAL